MSPALILPLTASSFSSVVWAITLMVARLSKQRTERIKHSRTVEFEREFLTSALTAYKDALAKGQTTDLVDVMLALRGAMTGWRSSEAQAAVGRIEPHAPMSAGASHEPIKRVSVTHQTSTSVRLLPQRCYVQPCDVCWTSITLA
jgi:hypothetical protein